VIEVWNMRISKLSSEICLWFNIKSKMHIKKVYKWVHLEKWVSHSKVLPICNHLTICPLQMYIYDSCSKNPS
jgi:hypothetical protein